MQSKQKLCLTYLLSNGKCKWFLVLHLLQMKRVKSAGTTRQMRQSPSWLAFLWSHKESDAESRPAEWLTVNEWWKKSEKRTTVHNNWWQKKRMRCCEEKEKFHWLGLNPFHELCWDPWLWKSIIGFSLACASPQKWQNRRISNFPWALGIFMNVRKLDISLLKS